MNPSNNNAMATAPTAAGGLHRGVRRAIVTVVALLAALAGSLAFTAPAEAASFSCGGGRCTVKLSKAETKALGAGKIPSILYRLPPPLNAVAVTAAAVHVAIARQYGKRNWCSGFRLSIFPWETQGYFGYKC